MNRTFYYCIIATPIGELLSLADDDFLHLLDFYHKDANPKQIINNFLNKNNILADSIVNIENHILSKVKIELEEYFSKKRTTFDIPLKIYGTDFQKKVYHNILKIQYGHYNTYKQLAISSESPKAYRAVGSACHNNNIVVIIPCHRVLSSDLSLRGYAGGLDNKKLLLNLENIYL